VIPDEGDGGNFMCCFQKNRRPDPFQSTKDLSQFGKKGGRKGSILGSPSYHGDFIGPGMKVSAWLGTDRKGGGVAREKPSHLWGKNLKEIRVSPPGAPEASLGNTAEAESLHRNRQVVDKRQLLGPSRRSY